MMNKMMRKSILAGAVLALALGSAQARRAAVPMVEPDRVVVATAEKPISADAMQQAIINGGASHDWTVVAKTPEKVTLRHVRKEIEATVDVSYDATGFKIQYVSSANLDSSGSGANAQIHPTYNNWIKNLNQSISLAATQQAGR